MFVSVSLLIFSWFIFLFVGILLGAWVILEAAK